MADQGLQVEGRHWITVSMNLITSGIPSLLFIYYLSNYKIETISLMCMVINVSHFLSKWTTITGSSDKKLKSALNNLLKMVMGFWNHPVYTTVRISKCANTNYDAKSGEYLKKKRNVEVQSGWVTVS